MIRQATIDDLAEILNLDESVSEVPLTKKQWEGYIADDVDVFVMHDLAGKLVGVAVGGYCEHPTFPTIEYIMKTVFVRDDCRKKSFGKLLVDEMKQSAISHNCNHMFCIVPEDWILENDDRNILGWLLNLDFKATQYTTDQFQWYDRDNPGVIFTTELDRGNHGTVGSNQRELSASVA